MVDFELRKFTACLLIFILGTIVSNIIIARQPLDQIVATVNDDIITHAELTKYKKLLLSRIDVANTALPPAAILEQQILNRLILDRIQLQLAHDTGIEVDSQRVTASLQAMAKDEGKTFSEMQQALESKGIAFNDFRHHIKNEILITLLQQREVGREITISSTDIDSFLNSPVGQDQTGTEYHLRHIVLSTPMSPTPHHIGTIQQQAEAIVAKLQAGADFVQIATAKSAGQQALKGGDLGWRSISQLPTLFVKHTPSMQLNEIVGPIRSANGFHIIKLIGKRVGNKEAYVETHVRQILIKPNINTSDKEASVTLSAMRAQILHGDDFAKLAKQKSEELSTAANGGDLGWITEKSVLPSFYNKIANLAAGEISQPFNTPLGWHLVQVLAKRTADTSPEAARNKAAETIRTHKYHEMLESWLKRLQDNAQIEIMLNS